MKRIDRATYYYGLIICCVFVCGILVQSNILCNTDANWLLHATARLLDGGKYYYTFFEPNPPMILYINITPVIIAKFLHLTYSFVFRIYVFLIAIFSMVICSVLLKKIYQDRPTWTRRMFVVAIVFIFVILPIHAFGEREHIALILTMPYFFLAVLRGRNVDTSIIFAILIGILAGIGFAIKPYFVIPFVLIELYLMFKRKNMFAWFRTESMIIGSILVLYLISIYIFTPEYIYKVLPLVEQFYYAGFSYPWGIVINSAWIILFSVSIGYFVLFYDLVAQKELIKILFFASIGFVIVYFLQRTAWFYHALPSYAFLILMIVLILQEIIAKPADFSVKQKCIKSMHISFLTAVLFIFAVVVPGSIFYRILKRDASPGLTRTIAFIKNNTPNRKICFFSPTVDFPYRYIDMINVKSISRFPSQFLLPGLIDRLASARTTKEKNKILKYKQEIINMVVEDFQLYKPDLIIIFKCRLDYIDFFSQNKKFEKLINSYRYVNQIDNLVFYRRRK